MFRSSWYSALAACLFLFFTPFASNGAVIEQISPSAAPQGATVSVVVRGSGFVPGVSKVRVAGTGVLVTLSEALSSDTISATLVLSAAPGTRNVFVQGPDGSSNSLPFAIQPTRRSSAREFDVTHLAGGPGGSGYADGRGSQARFSGPTGLWGVGGTLYVAEIGQQQPVGFGFSSGRVRKVITATGEVSTLATLPEQCPGGGSQAFGIALSVWADTSDVYVGDRCLRVIYKISAATGEVHILAGQVGQRGSTNGSATDARFSFPTLLWGDDTYIYVWDGGPGMRRVDKQTGETSSAFSEFPRIFSGDGTFVYRFVESPEADFGTLQMVRLATGEVTNVGPYRALVQYGTYSGVLIWRRSEASGDFLYAIAADNTVLKIRISDGTGVTFAGGIGTTSRTVGPTFGAWKDGPGNAAEFYYPYASWADDDYLYFVEPYNHTLRRVRFSTAEVSTLAGLPALCCYLDGPADQARFYISHDVWGDGNDLYISDPTWNTIRRLRIADGATSTFAGSPRTGFNPPSLDGVGQAATFSEPRGIWGDGKSLYVTERTGRKIRKIDIATGEVSTLAGNTNALGAAGFISPGGIWGDGAYLYVVDDSTIRTVNIATREVRTLAGSPGQYGNADGVGAAARFGGFTFGGIWSDGSNLYVADSPNNTVRRIVIATGEVSTLAGSAGMQGSADGAGSNARFNAPRDVWGDGTFLYVADSGNATIRSIRLDTQEVLTVAGVPREAGSNDGRGGMAHLITPVAIWGDGADLYVVEFGSIRRLSIPRSGDEPVISAIMPASVAVPSTTTFTVAGTNFVPGQTNVLVVGGGVRVFGVDVQTTTSIVFRIEVAPDATAGSRTLRVLRGDAVSNPVAFSVGTIDRTTQSFPGSANGATSMSTSDQPGAPVIGYARIEPDGGGVPPAGLAIYGYRTGGVLVSEAAVPATGRIQSGRLHYFGRGASMTGIAVANPTDHRVRFAYSMSTPYGCCNRGYFDLMPGEQMARFMDENPLAGAVSGSAEQTFTFETSAPIAVVALRSYVNERSEVLMTTLPVADLNAPMNRPLVFPHLVDGAGWSSQIVLVNPTDQPISGVLQFLSQSGVPQTITIDGQSGTEFRYSLDASRSQRLQTAGLSAGLSSGWVRIIPDGNVYPRGLIIFSYRRGGVVVTEAGVPAMESSQAFRLYVESAGPTRTGFAIANPSLNNAEVRFELTDSAGNPAGTAGARSIPPNGQIALFLDEVEGFTNLPRPFKGVLRISTANGAGISVIGLRGRYNERNDFLITTAEPVNETAPPPAEAYFPHFVQAGGYTTQFVLFPGVPNSASGALRFFSPLGQAMNVELR